MKGLKAISVGCVLTMMISLAACSTGGDSEGGVETGKMLTTESGYQIPEIDLGSNNKITIVSTGNERYDTEDGLISQFFKKYYGGTIESRVVGYQEYATTLATMVNSGEPAHLMGVNGGFPDYAISKLVLPVDDIGMDYEALGEDFAPLKSVYDAYVYDGKHYMLPWSSLAYQKIFYNKKVFEDNEIPTPLELFEEGKWTLDAMYDTAKQLHIKGNGDEVERLGMAIVGWHGAKLVHAGGQHMINIDGTNLVNNISNSSAANAINLLRDMVITDRVAQVLAEDAASDMFSSGKTAMVLGPFFWCETDGLFDELRQTKSLEWVVLPKESEQSPNYVYANGGGYYIPQGVKESDYALIKAFMISSCVELSEEGKQGTETYTQNYNKWIAKYGEWGYTEEDYQHYNDMCSPKGLSYVVEPMEAIFDPYNLVSSVVEGTQSFEQAVAEFSPGVEADLEMLVEDAVEATPSSNAETPSSTSE